MRKIALSVLLLSIAAFAQGPPATNAPQFTANFNFFGGTPYGQTTAMDAATTVQFTANTQLRADVFSMPSAGYTGYGIGPQYNLCGLKPVESALALTTFSCGKIMPYAGGAVGYGRVQQGALPSQHGLAGWIRAGLNYDPTGSGRFSLNVVEAGWGHFGPAATLAGATSPSSGNGWFAQTGLQIGLGTSAASTQAKADRMRLASAKKAARLQRRMNAENARIQQAQKP